MILKPLTWAKEEEKKIMGLSNHQWPVEEDEGSAKQQQIYGMGHKLKYKGICKHHAYDKCMKIHDDNENFIFTLAN